MLADDEDDDDDVDVDDDDEEDVDVVRLYGAPDGFEAAAEEADAFVVDVDDEFDAA